MVSKVQEVDIYLNIYGILYVPDGSELWHEHHAAAPCARGSGVWAAQNADECRVEAHCVGCSMHPEVQELAIHPNLNITHEGDARSEL